MKCTIPGANCKILAKAIHALARIGEEMYVQPREKSLSFRCVSMSNSAYCDFTFQDIYFSSYTFGNLDEDDALKCKISMRSALTVFKSPANIDKLVETCHIRLEPNADQLIFIFKFKNSVVKTFFLPILDCEQLSVLYTKDTLPNKLSAKSRVFTDAVQNFQHNLIEVTVEVTPQKLLMRNYVDETCTVANSTRTQLALTIGEFDEYSIGLEARITFCMKELRAILTFAEGVALPINVYFEMMGKPVLFDLKNTAFEVNLVLSTLNPDGDDLSISTPRDISHVVRKRPAAKKAPRQLSNSSAKRPRNKSTASKKSTNNKSNVTARTIEANRSDVSDRMDVDDKGATTSGLHPPHLSNLDFNSRNDSPILSHGSVQKHLRTSTTTSTYAASSHHPSPAVSSLDPMSTKGMEPSIFSPGWKKQSSNNNKEDDFDFPMDEDVVPGSPTPPSKKAKLIFKKCFHTTFDPRMLPGHDRILAEDSDEDN